MAKRKGKSAQPVPGPRKDPNILTITIGIPKPRTLPITRGGRHQNLPDDVRKGRSRKRKHKNKPEE